MSTQPIVGQLAQIQDWQTRRTFELVVAALQQILSALGQKDGAPGSAGPLTAAQIAQVKAALEASGTHPLQLVGLTQGALTSFTKAANEFLDSFNAATGVFTGSQPAASNLSNGTTGTGAVVLANAPTFTANPTFASVTGSGAVVEATGPTISAPTLSGHPTIEGVTSTGATGMGKLVYNAGATLATATLDATTSASITNLPVFANNAAAITGGLVAGNLYRLGTDPDQICVVH